jgi:hypothetical protein
VACDAVRLGADESSIADFIVNISFIPARVATIAAIIIASIIAAVPTPLAIATDSPAAPAVIITSVSTGAGRRFPAPTIPFPVTNAQLATLAVRRQLSFALLILGCESFLR